MSIAGSVADSSTMGVYGYALTAHAREQMLDARITPLQVAECLEYPTHESDRSTIHCTYWNESMGVFVNEKTHTVVAIVRTEEWKELRESVKDAPTIIVNIPEPTERRSRRRTNHVAIPAPRLNRAHVLDGVHPSLHAEISRQVDGDYSRVVIESRTRVLINPPRH